MLPRPPAQPCQSSLTERNKTCDFPNKDLAQIKLVAFLQLNPGRIEHPQDSKSRTSPARLPLLPLQDQKCCYSTHLLYESFCRGDGSMCSQPSAGPVMLYSHLSDKTEAEKQLAKGGRSWQQC